MKKMMDYLRGAWWVVVCIAEVAGWLCWGAWRASREEMRDVRGYADGTR